MRFGTFDHMKRRNRSDYQRKHDTNRGHCVPGFDVSIIALLDKNYRQLVEEQVREVEKIETAVQEDF
jgi:hypothetical protein